jgi:hypothetical protein
LNQGPPTNEPGAGVPYEKAAPNAYKWTERAYDLLIAGDLTAEVRVAAGVQTAYVTGECPHCRHDVRFDQVLDAVAGEVYSTLGESISAPESPYIPLVASCRCSEPHEGRPEKTERGCGINFRIEILANA